MSSACCMVATRMNDKPDTAAHHDRMLGAQQPYVLPADAREVILVRHGAAERDQNVILPFGKVTLADPPLSSQGLVQARVVAGRLANERVAQIYVTPLQRTQQTAAPLEALTGLKSAVVPELREAYLGDWELDFYNRVASNDPILRRMYVEESWDMIPNAEPMGQFAARVRQGVSMIIDSLAAGAIAVAYIHGGTISELCRQATASRPFAFFAPENTSVSRLVVQRDGRWTLRCFNDVAHLAAISPTGP
jgi:2,3-bisphosphoglycerate-dependent phosphoglycerate mutase